MRSCFLSTSDLDVTRSVDATLRVARLSRPTQDGICWVNDIPVYLTFLRFNIQRRVLQLLFKIRKHGLSESTYLGVGFFLFLGFFFAMLKTLQITIPRIS